MESAISIQNLSIQFNKSPIKALNQVSFNLELGKTLALVGESGSGKSLSSLAIMGLLPKNANIKSGKILFANNDKEINLLEISNKAYREIRGTAISMIFQEPMTSLNPTITCGKQVAEMLSEHTNLSRLEIEKKTIELFNEVKLPRPENIFKSYPHEISGGQKQRVMIAMAIALKPKLLIADEPTTALDVTVQKEILKLLADLQKKNNMSILFITHDLAVVKDIADDIVIMHKGIIVETGKTKVVLSNPQDPYTKGLLASKPPLNTRPERLQTVASFLESSVNEFKLISGQERNAMHKEIYANKADLEVRNLITSFPIKKNFLGKVIENLKAVNNVSFDLYKGETLGLVGESGCGKTTLGRTILKLETASDGEIFYKGKDILKFNKKEMLDFRRKFQIIFQDPYSSLNPKLTVGATIMEVMEVHSILSNKKERLARTIELLRKVGLEAKHFEHYPHEFSGGQRQRVGIARALALQPEYIICDESVSALDVSVQAQVLNLLNDLKDEFQLTYIFISHDLSVVRYMSDRVIVMNKGKIEELEEADKLFQYPKTDYTKSLIDSIPGFDL